MTFFAALPVALLAAFILQIRWVGPVSLRETLFYAQKICFAGLALHWFAPNEKRLHGGLYILGTYAFPIYFLHAIFLILFIEAERALLSGFPTIFGALVLGVLSIAFSLAVPIGICLVAQQLLGKRSRMLVGA